MGFEILFSGLCILNLASGAREVLCPSHGGHVLRLVVAAEQITDWPSGKATWIIGPDGQEYAAFEFTKASITYKMGNTVVNDAASGSGVGLMRVSHIERTLKLPPANSTFKLAVGAGKLEAVDPIANSLGVPFEYYVTENGQRVKRTFQENLRWSHSGDTMTVKFNGNRTLVISSGATAAKISLTNDVATLTGGPDMTHKEFDHWGMVKALQGKFVAPDRGLVTSRPICNLLVNE